MPSLKSTIGAVALASAAMTAFAGGASATTVTIYGGGSTLIQQYWRQAMDCYGVPAKLVIASHDVISVTPFNFTGTPAQNCATQHTTSAYKILYDGTGSGTGIKAVFAHDGTLLGPVNPPAHKHTYWSLVQYALSDAGLANTDVAVWNSGGPEQGLTFVAPGHTASPPTNYPNPRQSYGPMVQFPVSIDPVAIGYDPTYEVDNRGGTIHRLHFHIAHPRADGSGGLKLDKATYCRIFAGLITNWNDPRLKALNSNQSLEDPDDLTPSGSWSVPLQIVGRFDNSGTTSIWTRHLADVCTTILPSNPYTDGSQQLPTSLKSGAHWTNGALDTSGGAEALGKYTLADGNSGVAQYVQFALADPAMNTDTAQQGRMGYMGPDFVLPAAINTGAVVQTLNSASIKNTNDGKFYAPNGPNALLAFGGLRPPQSNADGTYNPSSTDRNRAHPNDWVEAPTKLSVLADPETGYPIIGTTNFIGYTCYKTLGSLKAIKGAISWYYSSPTVTNKNKGLLTKAGLAPLPPAWNTAIVETFTGNTTGLGLQFNQKGKFNCASATVGG